MSSGVVNPVKLANLTLKATSANQCAFELGTRANVSLILAGANTLASGSNRAGLQVAVGRTLSITNAPGDETASLSATGGGSSAGIGSGYNINGGRVTINGGEITAKGGSNGAGIGGGYYGDGGRVTINGGTVMAQGGSYGAGIGGATMITAAS